MSLGPARKAPTLRLVAPPGTESFGGTKSRSRLTDSQAAKIRFVLCEWASTRSVWGAIIDREMGFTGTQSDVQMADVDRWVNVSLDDRREVHRAHHALMALGDENPTHAIVLARRYADLAPWSWHNARDFDGSAFDPDVAPLVPLTASANAEGVRWDLVPYIVPRPDTASKADDDGPLQRERYELRWPMSRKGREESASAYSERLDVAVVARSGCKTGIVREALDMLEKASLAYREELRLADVGWVK